MGSNGKGAVQETYTLDFAEIAKIRISNKEQRNCLEEIASCPVKGNYQLVGTKRFWAPKGAHWSAEAKRFVCEDPQTSHQATLDARIVDECSKAVLEPQYHDSSVDRPHIFRVWERIEECFTSRDAVLSFARSLVQKLPKKKTIFVWRCNENGERLEVEEEVLPPEETERVGKRAKRVKVEKPEETATPKVESAAEGRLKDLQELDLRERKVKVERAEVDAQLARLPTVLEMMERVKRESPELTLAQQISRASQYARCLLNMQPVVSGQFPSADLPLSQSEAGRPTEGVPILPRFELFS